MMAMHFLLKMSFKIDDIFVACYSFNYVLINQKQNHKQNKMPFIIGLDSDSIHQIDRKLLAVRICRFYRMCFLHIRNAIDFLFLAQFILSSPFK